MRKVSASDWIRRSAEYPADDHLTLAPPKVRTIRAGKARTKADKKAAILPPVAAAAGKATGLPPVAAAAGKAPQLPAVAASTGELSARATTEPRLPPVAAAAGKAPQLPAVATSAGELATHVATEPQLPPVAAAAGRAAREADVSASPTPDGKSPAPASKPVITRPEVDLPPPGSRMQAYIEPAAPVVRHPRPQFEPLPVQLPSHALVSKVTRQRGQQPGRTRPRGAVAAEIFAAAFLLIGVVFALVVGGHFEKRGSMRGLVNHAASLVGLSAENVHIIGLDRQTREQVLAAIGVEENGSLIGFDAGQARQTLENLDWVSRASVQRLFPNRLLVELTERHPFALWQSDGVFKVIDKSGIPMPSMEVKAHRHLPIVVGEGANISAAELVNHLEAQPTLMSLVRAAVRVADRRWVLYLTNTIKVDLPEEDVDEALGLLVSLTDRYGVMSRDITRVDMRLNDRVVVTLSDEAVEKLNQSKSTKPIRVSRSN